jgi:hypothetical protein
MNKISNSQLLEKDIPANTATWKKILPFALTFNGSEHWGSFEKCREVAKTGIASYRDKKPFTLSLTDLRTCLYYEARRWNHLDKNPNKLGLAYIHALLDAIRVRVLARELG